MIQQISVLVLYELQSQTYKIKLKKTYKKIKVT